MRHALLQSTLQGPIIPHAEAAAQNLEWLTARGIFSADTSMQDAVRQILSRMVTNETYSVSLINVLDRWAAWTAIGSMSIDDLLLIHSVKREFAEASLMVAAVAGLQDGSNGGLVELQKCAERWEYVLLG